MAERTIGSFCGQTSFPHLSIRPDQRDTMSLSEMTHTISTPLIADSNGYQLKQLMLNHSCLPQRNEPTTLHHLLKPEEDLGIPSRAKRQFVPTNKKDNSYWLKRCKNNDSARRSRFKRKCLDKILEKKLAVLQNENCRLKYELKMFKQNSKKISTKLFTSNAVESTHHDDAFGTYSHYQPDAKRQNRYFPEQVKLTKSTNSSGDERDSSHSSSNYDSGEYPNAESSPSCTSDHEAWRSASSVQSADGSSSSESMVCPSDSPSGGWTTPDDVDEKISSLQFTEKVQKVPHKLRIKKNMHSIVESSCASEDISYRESYLR